MGMGHEGTGREGMGWDGVVWDGTDGMVEKEFVKDHLISL